MLSPSQASLLRSLSLGDEGTLSVVAESTEGALDSRTAAIIRLTALIVHDAALPGYQRGVRAALDAGVTVDEILSLLCVIAQPAGSTAVVAAAPKLAMALGYDVDAGLEELGA